MAFSRGEFLVAWEQTAETFVPGVIRAQRVSAAGALVGAAIDVSRRGIMGDASVGPSVAGDVSGWIVARRESGNSYSSAGATRMVGRLLPYENPTAGGPEVALDEARSGFFGVPSLAAGTRGTLVAWRPLMGAAPPVARLAGAGGDPGAAVWDAAPTGVLATRSAELRFHSTRADARFECLVDEGAWEACASPLALTGLTDRVHSATVRSVAPEGWVELVASTATRWRTEAAPPETRITQPPDPASKYPEIAFAADEASLFDCRVDGGDWAYCAEFGWGKASLTGGFSFRGVADGPHVFEVRAIDESGRVEPEPARWVFTLDRREPETRIQAGPVTEAQWERPGVRALLGRAGRALRMPARGRHLRRVAAVRIGAAGERARARGRHPRRRRGRQRRRVARRVGERLARCWTPTSGPRTGSTAPSYTSRRSTRA